MNRIISSNDLINVVRADLVAVGEDSIIFYCTRHDIAVLKRSDSTRNYYGFEYASYLLHRSVAGTNPSNCRTLVFTGNTMEEAVNRALKSGRKVFGTSSVQEMVAYAAEHMAKCPE